MGPEGSRPSARPARAPQLEGLRCVVLALAAALAMIHLALPIASLPRLVPLLYNEGWNAYHAAAVWSERPLYPGPGELFTNNYPPLSFGVVALASRAIGDPLRAGRVLSLLAFLALLIEIGWLAWRVTGSRSLGIYAGLLFAATMAAAFEDYVATDDPQLMAHALMLGGLVLVSGGRSPARLALAALLMGLSGLVKHNLVALPVALTLWLFGRDRRALAAWLTASALVVAAAFVSLWALFGEDVFASVLGPRVASAEIAARVSAEWLRSLAGPLALGILAAREAWRDPDARLLALYAALALATGFAFTAGQGVSYNAYFDLLIALCLLAAFLLARVATLVPAGARVIPLGALALAGLVDPLLRAPNAVLSLPARIEENAQIERAMHEDIAYLAARGGPALCESLALCFWAGKPPSVDLFNSRQLFLTGRVDEDALLERVASGEFAVVELSFFSPQREDQRVSPQLAHALQLHYVVDRVSANGVFLRPRQGPRAPAR